MRLLDTLKAGFRSLSLAAQTMTLFPELPVRPRRKRERPLTEQEMWEKAWADVGKAMWQAMDSVDQAAYQVCGDTDKKGV